MRRTIRQAVLAMGGVAALMGAPAQAGAPDGKWQVKALITGVLADGAISKSGGPAVGVLAGSNAGANDNVVPTVAIEYFLSPNISVETICCMTAHTVTGTGALDGVDLVTDVHVIPATLALKAHADLGAIKPYVGAGPAVMLFVDKKVSAPVAALGIASVDIAPRLGAMVQAGVDIPLGATGLGFSVDVKRYFVRPVARFKDAAGAEQLWTRHKLDPLLLSAGLSYRF